MKRIVSIAATVVVGAGSLGATSTSVNAQPGPASAGDVRIIGGEVVTEPITWMAGVGIRVPGTCTGSMIAPQWVLTAGHCLAGIGMNVGPGKNNFMQAPRIKVVEQHFQQGKHDLALLKIETAVEGVTFVKLTDAQPAIGATATAWGWGMTSESGGRSEDVKRCTVTIQSFDRKDNAGGPAITTMKGSGMGWKGDSGGPLTVEGVQVGVLSTGEVTKGLNHWVDISKHREWIRAVSGV